MNPVLIVRAALVLLAIAPATAFASGFYLPWWGEALLFLLVNPWGWALLSLALIVLAVGAFKFWRRK